MPTERVGRWQQDQSKGFEFGVGEEDRVVRGVVGVDFGKMKGKRVERIRKGSMRREIAAVLDKDKAVENAVGGVVVDGMKRSDHWLEKNADGG